MIDILTTWNSESWDFIKSYDYLFLLGKYGDNVVYSYADSRRKNHNDAMIKNEKTSLEKYVPLTLS